MIKISSSLREEMLKNADDNRQKVLQSVIDMINKHNKKIKYTKPIDIEKYMCKIGLL